MKDAPLDMRFDRDSDVSAYDIVNGYSEDDLIRIISEYGEEKFTKRIVKNIINYRQSKNIETTGELAQIIKCRSQNKRKNSPRNPHVSSNSHRSKPRITKY